MRAVKEYSPETCSTRISVEVLDIEVLQAKFEIDLRERIQKELANYFVQNFLFKHGGKLMQSLVDEVNEGFLAKEVAKEVASIIAKRIMKEHVEEKK